jgi:hypothetical protein
MEFLGDRRLDGMGLLPDTVKYAYGTFDKIEIASQQSAFLPLVGSTGPLSGYISSSTFTCPIDGVYSISAYFGTTDPNNGEGINTHIQVDHHDGYGWVNVGGLSNMNPTIRTPQVCMVLPLKKGDGIAIKIANIGVSTRSYCDHFTTVGSSDAGLPNWCIALIEQSVPAIVADSHYVQSSDELYEVRIDPSTGIMSPNGMFIKEIPNKFWDWLETNGFRDLTLPAERFNELGLTDYNNGRTIYI